MSTRPSPSGGRSRGAPQDQFGERRAGSIARSIGLRGLAPHRSDDHLDSVGIKFTLECEPCNAAAFLTRPDAFTKLVTDAVERQTGRRPALSTSGGTSDARFIRAFCPVVEFGLVGATAHMVDEHIAIADIEALTEIYAAILEDYFG
jgi:acetylornithine deacetylase/succinyl-diaminopimelate desuccinylase-like protein